MKNRLILMTIVYLFSFSLIAQNKFKNADLTGSWNGKIKVQGYELRIVFHLTSDDNNKLKATMDSPDQGAKGIAMGEVKFVDGKLKIDAPTILGYYEGKMIKADSISGTWNQSGQTFDVPLNKKVE